MAKFLVLLATFVGLASAGVMDRRIMGERGDDLNLGMHKTLDHRMDLLHGLHDSCRRCITDRNTVDCNTCVLMTRNDLLDRLGDNCLTCINQRSDRDCNICQDHIGRDRLVDRDIQRDTLVHDAGLNRLEGVCRQCIDRNTVTDCLSCLMRTNIETLRNLPRDCVICIRHRINRHCDTCRDRMRDNVRDDGMLHNTRDVVVDNVRGADMLHNTRLDVNSVHDLPTTSINNDRLLHVNRRKLMDINRIDDKRDVRDHTLNVLHGHGIDDGRKIKQRVDLDVNDVHMGHDLDVVDVLNRMDGICRRCITGRNEVDCLNCRHMVDHKDLMRLGENCMSCIRRQIRTDCIMCEDRVLNRERSIGGDRMLINNERRIDTVVRDLPTTTINDDRLLHVNRKKLISIQGIDNMGLNDKRDLRDRFMNVVHRHGIDDGRKILRNDDVDMNGRVGLHRDVNRGVGLMDHRHEGLISDVERRDDVVQRRGSNVNMDAVRDLPTTTIDDDRLLHVNRKKLRDITGSDRLDNMRADDNRLMRERVVDNRNMRDRIVDNGNIHDRVDDNLNMRHRFLIILHGRGIDDGRKTKQRDDSDMRNRMNWNRDRTMDRDMDLMDRRMLDNMDVLDRMGGICRRCIVDRNSMDCHRCLSVTDINDLLRLGGNCMACLHRQPDVDCNMCLQRLNIDRMIGNDNMRRRLDDNDDIRRDGKMHDVNMHRLGDNDDMRRDWMMRDNGMRRFDDIDTVRRGSMMHDVNTRRLGDDDDVRGMRRVDDIDNKRRLGDNDDMRRDWMIRDNGMRRLDDGDNMRRGSVMHDLWRKSDMNDNLVHDLPTTSIDDDRLLHVNRKKLIAMKGIDNIRVTENGNMRDRFMSMFGRRDVDDDMRGNWGNRDRMLDNDNMRRDWMLRRRDIDDGRKVDDDMRGNWGNRDRILDNDNMHRDWILLRRDIDDGRKVDDDMRGNWDNRDRFLDNDNMRRDWRVNEVDDDMRRDWMIRDNRLNKDCVRCINHRTMTDCNTCRMTIDDDVLRTLHKDCLKCIKSLDDKRCDSCVNVMGLRY